MSPVYHESAFGEAIVEAMLANGWRLGNNADYRPDLALDTAQLFEFIGATQIREWNDLLPFYGGDANAAQAGFAKRLDQAISSGGLLEVLRRGVQDHGALLRGAYVKPPLATSDAMLNDY